MVVFGVLVLVAAGFRIAAGAFDGIDGDDIRPWGLALVEGLMVAAVWAFAVRRRRASWTALGLRPVGPRAMYLLPLGVMVASLLFAAAHVSVGAALPVFVAGMLLAWLYVRTRSIWPPLTAHALQNFIAVSVVQ